MCKSKEDQEVQVSLPLSMCKSKEDQEVQVSLPLSMCKSKENQEVQVSLPLQELLHQRQLLVYQKQLLVSSHLKNFENRTQSYLLVKNLKGNVKK